jgi:hypothetical protein
MVRVLALASALATTSCGGDLFACSDDEDCAGGASDGICVAAGACAFPDDDCPSGHRYGDHAGQLSGECVPPFDDTTGGDDTSGPGSPTTLDPTAVSLTLDATSNDADATTSPADTTSTTDPTTPVTLTDDLDSSDDGTTAGPNDDPDLLVWLRFDELTDEGVPNDGVLGGAATCLSECPVVSGGTAQFDGATTCMVVAHDDLLASTTFSAAAWVRRPDVPLGWFLFGKAYGDDSQNSWELYMSNSMRLGQYVAVEVVPDALVSSPVPPVDVWAHIAATYDGGTLSLFVDGELAGQIAVDNLLYDDHDLRIGCDADAGVDVYFFPGWLADVRVYKRALDELEIDALVAVPPAP